MSTSAFFDESSAYNRYRLGYDPVAKVRGFFLSRAFRASRQAVLNPAVPAIRTRDSSLGGSRRLTGAASTRPLCITLFVRSGVALLQPEAQVHAFVDREVRDPSTSLPGAGGEDLRFCVRAVLPGAETCACRVLVLEAVSLSLWKTLEPRLQAFRAPGDVLQEVLGREITRNVRIAHSLARSAEIDSLVGEKCVLACEVDLPPMPVPDDTSLLDENVLVVIVVDAKWPDTTAP